MLGTSCHTHSEETGGLSELVEVNGGYLIAAHSGLIAEEGIRLDTLQVIKVVTQHTRQGGVSDGLELSRSKHPRTFIIERISSSHIGKGDPKDTGEGSANE